VRRAKVQSFSTATFSKSNYLEIIPPGVNKAKAVAELAQTLGVELSQVAALGEIDGDWHGMSAWSLPLDDTESSLDNAGAYAVESLPIHRDYPVKLACYEE
jgi:hypothetical protein